MSSPNHPTFDIEDAFSFNSSDYISTSLDYFLASPGNISPDSSNDLTKYLLTSLAILPYHNDPYIIQAYDDIPPPQAIIALPAVFTSISRSSSLVRSTTSPPDYPFDKSILAELDNSLWIIPRPLGSKPVLEEPNESDAYLQK
uniref:Uncharacterized protein n=1 Tax=Tanacetum cinerariifolium TaxID=118510 RepID=A0A6L2KTB1_TANCI|nr:hypothetical protein [Tanacetum cinerariifolium]